MATATRMAKKHRFRLAKQQLCMCITLFCTFLCRHCTTTKWKCLISRFVKGVNTREWLSFSFPELWYSLLKFNSRKIYQHLMNWTSWNKCNKVWNRANSLFKWHFHSHRWRCCLSSLIIASHQPLLQRWFSDRLLDNNNAYSSPWCIWLRVWGL